MIEFALGILIMIQVMFLLVLGYLAYQIKELKNNNELVINNICNIEQSVQEILEDEDFIGAN
jgi:hypothetical protein